MDAEKFTERSRGFIQAAQGLALRSNNQQFTTEHLLKVLLDDEEGLAARLIRAAGGQPRRGVAPDRTGARQAAEESKAAMVRFIWPRKPRGCSTIPRS